MSQFKAQDPNFEERVRSSFARQQVMTTIGATMDRVAPGEVDIRIPYRSDLTQQHGFMHGGIIATIADSSCGYAAFSLMPADVGVLSIEFKINLLRPASGDYFVSRARVLRAGRTIMSCAADVFAGPDDRLVSTMLATIMTITDKPGVEG